MSIVLGPERQPDETEVEWIERLQRYHPAKLPENATRVLLDRQRALLIASPWVPHRVRARLDARERGEDLPPEQPRYTVPR